MLLRFLQKTARRWERHKIPVVLALHDERATTPMRLTATDISASGCYVETSFLFIIGTSLKVDLWIASEKLTTVLPCAHQRSGTWHGNRIHRFETRRPAAIPRISQGVESLGLFDRTTKQQGQGLREGLIDCDF